MARRMLRVLDGIIVEREEELRILQAVHREARDEWNDRMLAMLFYVIRELPRLNPKPRKIVRRELAKPLRP